VSTARAAATAQRLETRAKALAHALEARAFDQRASIDVAHAGVMAAYDHVRGRRHVTSFACAALEVFSRACAARIAFHQEALSQTLAQAERARVERRHWGSIARGLRRRAGPIRRTLSWHG
jgi:hypothetical protein